MKRFFSVLAIVIVISFTPLKSIAQNQTVKNGALTNIVNFPGDGCVYNWVNDNPSIGLPASGTGNIASFTATNTNNSPITATITATPINSGFAYIFSTIGQLSVINTATDKVIATSPISFNPYGETVSPDGKFVYVTDHYSENVLTLDASTYAVIASTSTGPESSPQSVAVSPDGSKIYVTHNNLFKTGSVDEIDAVTHTVTSTIYVGLNPVGITLNSDGSRIYVANQSSNTVSVIDVATKSVIQTIQVGLLPIALQLTPDGKTLYVVNNSSTVSVINAATNAVINSILVGVGPTNLTISPDGKSVYVVNEDVQTVSVIDTKSQEVIATINLPGGDEPFSISITPDGKKVYVVNQNGLINVIDTSSNTVVTSITTTIGALSSGNFITAGVGCGNKPITFTITVNPTLPPKITATGNFSTLETFYGTASPQIIMDVNCNDLLSELFITAPVGFEISTDNSNFTKSITLYPDKNGTVLSTKIYIQLSPMSPVGNYSGPLLLKSTGANDFSMNLYGIVNPTELDIAANPVTKTFGTMLIRQTNSDAFIVQGLKNGEKTGSVVIDYGQGAEATALPGIYKNEITPSMVTGGTFTASNYKIIYLAGAINIEPEHLTIKADNKSKSFGIPNPELTLSYSGFVNNDSPAQLITPAQINTNVTLNTVIGQYSITVTGAEIPGYIINYIAGVFTVYSLDQSIIIPNIFTPNGDGANDKWYIQNLQYAPKCDVEIFNRYGLLLYHSSGYINAWDGSFNGKPLPSGTYYYLINLNDEKKPLSGYVCIVR
ncbi:MAG: beta-propeller fold lactonase family protein [Mucilaginibacter sp.]|nr:beta-propeller fold lactonase family protein [Mucilaginibacter sp.]